MYEKICDINDDDSNMVMSLPHQPRTWSGKDKRGVYMCFKSNRVSVTQDFGNDPGKLQRF